MKILIFCWGYYPAKGYGGPAISIENLVEQLSESFDFYIVTTNKEKNGQPLNVIKNKFIKQKKYNIIYLDNDKINKKCIFSLIKEINPDSIYINSFFDYYGISCSSIFIKKHNNKCKMIIAPRGQLEKNAFKIKRFKKILYQIYFKIFLNNLNILWHSTNAKETVSIKNRICKKSKILELKNVPSVQNKKNLCTFVEGSIKLVYIARIHSIKGLLRIVNAIKLSAISEHTTLDVFGPIEDSDYWNKCLENSENIHFNYKGILEHNKINDVLINYDFFVLPTDTENYGHSIIEALLSNVPVIISDNTPWSNLEEKKSGYICKTNTSEEYAEILKKIFKLKKEEYLNMVNSTDLYVNEYLVSNNLILSYKEMLIRKEV